MIPAVWLLITLFLKLNIFIVRSLKDSQNFFIQSLPLIHHTYFLFLNDTIVDIKKADGIRSLTFVLDDFSGF